jgi:hypothetical protein
MSYDLSVFAPNAVDEADLRGLVVRGGLGVEDGTAGSVIIVRGARRRDCFTIDGPDRVEDEDVPADVEGTVLGCRYLYLVTVDGSARSRLRATEPGGRLPCALDDSPDVRPLRLRSIPPNRARRRLPSDASARHAPPADRQQNTSIPSCPCHESAHSTAW